MQESLNKIKSVVKRKPSPRIIKKKGRFILLFIAFILLISGGLAFYVKANKAKILSQISTQISENINGTLEIGDLNYKFFAGFPNVTLSLKNVVIKDSLWATHKHTLLNAEEIELRLNVFKLFKSEKQIQEVVVNKASVYLFKAKNGQSNSNIFRDKPKESKSDKPINTIIDQLVLNDVSFISENQQGHKLFHFEVPNLKSKVKFNDDHIKAVIELDVLAKSMAFNVNRGTFIKDKKVTGIAVADYSKKQKTIDVFLDKLKIGEDAFDISGHFDLGKTQSPFAIDIKTNILWRNASKLLANNISSKLDLFNIDEPIKAHCTLKGDLNAAGDPEIVVTAEVRGNKLQIPDGTITNCNFDGKFTNNYVEGKGNNDANSAIVFSHFSGAYATIPFTIAQAKIVDFEKPIATGKLKSDFDVARLNEITNDEFMRFKKGNAKVNLDFAVDVANYKLVKPQFVGNVFVKNASLTYVPKNLTFDNTAVELYFTEEALLVQKISFKDRLNSVFMEFKIENFLNLYYNDPEKMLINWKIYSPYLNAKQFLGVLTTNQIAKKKKSRATSSFSDNLHDAFDKSQVVLDLKVDKIGYAKLVATEAKARIQIINNKLILEKGWVKSSGGNISFDGIMTPQKESYSISANAKVNGVDISDFLNSFDNFGIRSFSSESLKGKLIAQASVNGMLNPEGELLKETIAGVVKFNINKGALVDFEPIRKGWQLLVPFRDLNNITFSDLKGDFQIKGEKVAINELKISSNVINFDVFGIYSFGKGTNLNITVPLRNSKNDGDIKNKAEREDKRYRGIVLHLLATDGKDDKVKVKLVANPNK
ncbi:AsmA-like C-terminal region-containing protein [Flavobacterium frigoris]|uniref:AsmA domain-containing protein n=1 Tax=Flavobacterium frigoris (strain PS1) TaxID=1086011 RepID=H7FP34_FLAFP|nr:AsmA-like C-terminal region-containing protein [Flavobacterium frigoris]EIA09716.1 hypothetical protein HJ01_00932 [Flavobacterium frigoris PS1]